MKRFLFFLWIGLLGAILVGCGASSDTGHSHTGSGDSQTEHDSPGMEGYVIKVEGDRILVVESKVQDFSSTGGQEEFYSAIWFSKAPENMKVGQKVQVWFDIVAESYPGQSEAKKVVVLPSERPEGADLNESESIRKAFEVHDSDFMGVTAIKQVVYQDEKDVWEVVLKQEAEEFTIEVKDE